MGVNMKYTISEFAELLGITADTLRLYEKYGIIKPFKDKRNNYRYFDDMDARNMLISRWYRSMEIPIQEAAVLTMQASLGYVAEKIKERERDLEEEIKKKTMLLDKLAEITGSLEQAGVNLNKCTRKELPGIYRLRQTDKNKLVKDEALSGRAEEWMKLLPYAFFSFRINNRNLITNDTSFDYNWGLALYEEDVRRLDLQTDGFIEYMEPKTCISSVIVSSGEYIMRDSLQFMFEHLRKSHYTMNGDIFGKIIAAENAGSKRQYYLEVNIPIQTEE